MPPPFPACDLILVVLLQPEPLSFVYCPDCLLLAVISPIMVSSRHRASEMFPTSKKLSVGQSEHRGRRLFDLAFALNKTAPYFMRLAVILSCALSIAAVATGPARPQQNELDRDLGVGNSTGVPGRRRASDASESAVEGAREALVVREGIVFQTAGCPQVISEKEALAKAADKSIPGNVISLTSEGNGRAGNHFLVISDFFAMAYCCKTKVLKMPRYDQSFPTAESGTDGVFETDKRFFDFSGVDTMPLDEYEGLSKNPAVCKPYVELGGRGAIYLRNVHDDLLSCMNRVYVRGCEAAYLEPILGAERFGYCEKPAAAIDRRVLDNRSRQDPGAAPTTSQPPSIDTGSVATSDESQTAIPITDAGAPAAESGSSLRASSRIEKPFFLVDKDDDSDNAFRVHHTPLGEEGSSRNSNVSTRDVQASRASKATLDSRSTLRAVGEGDGELSSGGRQELGVKTLWVEGGDDKRILSRIGERGTAGSLVIHIRSGDIFYSFGPDKEPGRAFLSYGQPPLQFYLHVIASQPWSDVTILTSGSRPHLLNPTYVALQTLQQTGLLGPNVVLHKDRDLLTDIRAMLCADGLAMSRSTLHFFTFAHTRAKHLMVPHECGPGSYARGLRDDRNGDKDTTKKKPVPNNTTLLCIENPDIEIYGVDWKVDEAAYYLYDHWDSSPAQRQDMLLFDGVEGLSRCCAG
ncbi:unnamed protein product [Scytosiphon promiscuus]